MGFCAHVLGVHTQRHSLTHTHTHARTHARTHAHTHTHTQVLSQELQLYYENITSAVLQVSLPPLHPHARFIFHTQWRAHTFSLSLSLSVSLCLSLSLSPQIPFPHPSLPPPHRPSPFPPSTLPFLLSGATPARLRMEIKKLKKNNTRARLTFYPQHCRACVVIPACRYVST